MKSRSLKIALVATAALLLVMAIYGGAWYFILSTEKTVTMRIAEGALVSARQYELSTLTKLRDDTAEERKLLRSFVVTDDGVSGFLELIERTARGRGLVATIQSVAIETGEGPYETLVIELQVDGRYEGVKMLLEMFETMPFNISIRSLAFDRENAENAWRGTFVFSVTKEKKI